MSTILRALQKNKLVNNAAMLQEEPKENIAWKFSILSGLIVIIILLSIILYTRLTRMPVSKNTSRPLNQNPITKVVFLTRKIPKKDTEQKIIYIAASHKKVKGDEVTIASPAVTEPYAGSKSLSTKSETSEIKHQETASAQMNKRFALAASSTDHKNVSTDIKNKRSQNTNGNHIQDAPDIEDMPSSFQQRVPTIHYESHVYSSDKKYSSIEINGEKLKEGDIDSSGKLKVVDIEEQKTIFRLGRKIFSLKSLVDWNNHTRMANNKKYHTRIHH